MPLALLCWTVVYTVLLSLAETARLGENSGRALLAESTSGWSKLNLDVQLKRKYAGVSYTMVAEPVISKDGALRYNSYARFDRSSTPGFDPSIISYRQTDGYVSVINTSNMSDPSKCLDSESGPYPIPPINEIAQDLMYIKAATDSTDVTGCPQRFRIVLSDSFFEVCKGSDGASFTISGDDMDIKVTYNPKEEVRDNGGPLSKCTRAVDTLILSANGLNFEEYYGTTFLKP